MPDIDPPSAEDPAGDAVPSPPRRATVRARSGWRARLKRIKGPLLAFAAVGTVLGGLAGYWNGYRALRGGVQAEAPQAPQPAPPATAQPAPAADPRMRFAVLPVDAPQGHAEARRLADAAYGAVLADQQQRIDWATVVPRAELERALAANPTLNRLGQAVGARFLLQGSVRQAAAGWALDLALVDAASERRLDLRQVPLPADLDAAGRLEVGDAIESALGTITFIALRHEVAATRNKPGTQLDARDLAFRAWVEWSTDEPDRAQAWARARPFLERALAAEPDAPLNLKIEAQIKLCDCIAGPGIDPAALESQGLAALDRYLAWRPDAAAMREVRVWYLIKQRRFEDALLMAEDMLRREPLRAEPLRQRVVALLKLQRWPEAVAAVPPMLAAQDNLWSNSAAAVVHFEAGDDKAAATAARRALTQMGRDERIEPTTGGVALVLVAAEARAGRTDAARAAWRDLQAHVPSLKTVDDALAWLEPNSAVPEGADFARVLRRARLP